MVLKNIEHRIFLPAKLKKYTIHITKSKKKNNAYSFKVKVTIEFDKKGKKSKNKNFDTLITT